MWSIVLLILIINIIDVIIKFCLLFKFVLLFIIMCNLFDVIILNSKIDILFIIGVGIEWISVEILLINLNMIVNIVELMNKYILYVFVIVSILMFLLYVVFGGLLISDVINVVILLLKIEWCKFGFLIKFFLIIFLRIIWCLICFDIVISVIGIIKSIIFYENFGVYVINGIVKFGIINYFVLVIGFKFISFWK